MDKPYRIKIVQTRAPWTGTFGTFNSYALQLENVDGWVEISQVQKNRDGSEKEAPYVGQELFGHLELSKSKDGKAYQKFKKSTPQQSADTPASNKDMEYIKMMLEELTGRRPAHREPNVTEDILPDDDSVPDPYSFREEDDKQIDLSEIPF